MVNQTSATGCKKACGPSNAPSTVSICIPASLATTLAKAENEGTDTPLGEVARQTSR